MPGRGRGATALKRGRQCSCGLGQAFVDPAQRRTDHRKSVPATSDSAATTFSRGPSHLRAGRVTPSFSGSPRPTVEVPGAREADRHLRMRPEVNHLRHVEWSPAAPTDGKLIRADHGFHALTVTVPDAECGRGPERGRVIESPHAGESSGAGTWPLVVAVSERVRWELFFTTDAHRDAYGNRDRHPSTLDSRVSCSFARARGS